MLILHNRLSCLHLLIFSIQKQQFHLVQPNTVQPYSEDEILCLE